MIIAGKTDIGKARSENQDRYRVCEIDDSTAAVVVCDGMGGTYGGGVASDIASNAVYERLCLSYRDGMEPRSIKTLLISAVTAANALVYDKGIEDEQYRGMGTTCVAALVHKRELFVANVGDSRAYILDGSGIRQITCDHTVVQYLKSRGMIDENDEKITGMKNVITRAVGVEPDVEVDYFELAAEEGSVLLVCTDGLTNYCSDEYIYTVIYGKNLEEAATELINHCNKSGGKDNITVALVNIP